MNAWWQGLAERERRLLLVGALLVALLLGWALVWEPLDRSRVDWRQRAVAAEANLQWMRSAAEQLQRQRAAGGGAVVTDGRSLLARVDSGAREAGLGGALLRVEPTGPDQVRVQFQQAGFDDLMQWLEQIAQQQAVRVSELSVQRAQGVGLVDARVGLEQPSR
jgi:general secretion pathway protein M